LFEKIENIINRQGPYKKQSVANSKKYKKIFFAPSDHTVTASKYFERPSFSLNEVKKEHREMAQKKLKKEN